MTRTEEQARAKRNRRILYAVLGIGALAVVVGLLLPVFGQVSFVDPLLRQTWNLNHLGDALRSYADYNDGRFPSRLEDLVPECIPEDSPFRKFHDLRTKEAADWIYFPGYTAGVRPDTIIVASPKVVSRADGTRMVGAGSFRMILSADGRQMLIGDADYQACIREQREPVWTTAKSDAPQDIWHFLSSPAWSDWEKGDGNDRPKKGSPADVPKLLNSLKHGDRTDRWDAADALADMGAVTPDVVPALLHALGDDEADYNAACGLAAISLKDKSIVPALIQILTSKKAPASYWAVVALEKIGPEDTQEATPLLIEELANSSSDMRCEAAQAVAGIGPDAKAAVPKLIELLAEKDSWTCKCATIALGRIGPEARAAIPALLERFSADKDYQIDTGRALWKIDPARSFDVVTATVAFIRSQRNPNGPNKGMYNDFFSAIELLGEIGPDAKAALPLLRANLQGGAAFHSAWALWRIDPSQSDLVTPMLTRFLDEETPRDDRLTRLARGSRFARFAMRAKDSRFAHSFPLRMAAAGALWQIHPGKREALRPVTVALLREWETQKVLKKLDPETRSAIPALTDLLKNSAQPEMQLLTREALREINTTDPGRW